MEKVQKIKDYFKRHQAQMQAVLFIFFSLFAFVAQLLVQFLGDLAMKNVTQTVNIWPFKPQALGTFLSFMLANIVAKVVSFVMNRKKTFNANNNKLFSIISYTIMVVVLIIVETIIAEPFGKVLYNLFNQKAALEGCNTLAMILYSTADFVIVFLMDKFVIMRNIDKDEDKDENKDENKDEAEGETGENADIKVEGDAQETLTEADGGENEAQEAVTEAAADNIDAE